MSAVADPFGVVGRVIADKYRVDAVVAEGGFGVVYRGHHLGFEQAIAIKCLKIPSHFDAEAKALFWQRFREEGKLLARLGQHPSIVRVYDVGSTATATTPSLPYLVLEWLEGSDLETVLAERRLARREPYAEREALMLLRPVVDALRLAHEQGVAHRDVKPGNVFLAHAVGGRVTKLLDFGIAKAMQEGESASRPAAKTSSGFSAFSAGYAAPEQFDSGRFGASGPWTDVHAVGMLLAELASGRAPFAGTDAQIFALAVGETRPTPRELGARVSDGFEGLCARALARDPAARFPDAGALLVAFDALLAASVDAPAAATHEHAAHAPPTADAALDTAQFLAKRPAAGPSHDAVRAETPQVSIGEASSRGPDEQPTQLAPSPPVATFVRSPTDVPRTEVPRTERRAPPAPPRKARWPWVAGAIGTGAVVLVALLATGSPGAATSASAGSARDAPSGARPAGSVRAAQPAADGMLPVPAGRLMMGCPPSEANCADDERPAHEVELDAFRIDATEVTVARYMECVRGGDCTEPSMVSDACNWTHRDRSQHPVNCVTWDQADRYCHALGKRLPTEAEWEMAARGSDGRLYPWGAERPSCERAIMSDGGDGCGRRSTWPVGSKPLGASPVGALDMVGNVAEWVADDYDRAAYASSPARNPLVDRGGGAKRVRRGGSFREDGPLRATSRDGLEGRLGGISTGLRCAARER